jgi:hypothetical protein
VLRPAGEESYVNLPCPPEPGETRFADELFRGLSATRAAGVVWDVGARIGNGSSRGRSWTACVGWGGCPRTVVTLLRFRQQDVAVLRGKRVSTTTASIAGARRFSLLITRRLHSSAAAHVSTYFTEATLGTMLHVCLPAPHTFFFLKGPVRIQNTEEHIFPSRVTLAPRRKRSPGLKKIE